MKKEMYMTMPDIRLRSVRHEAGVALVSVILLSVMALILTGALATLMFSGMNGTRLARAGEVTRGLAEAGINATVFRIEAATNPSTGPISIETYLTTALGTATLGNPRAGTLQFTGTLSNGTYTVTLTDSSAGDGVFTLSSVGTDPTGQTRNLVAWVKSEPSAALNYAMFGNHLEFHNHDHVNYGLILQTALFSNGDILIDKGISINGLAQAVNTVQPNTGPSSGSAIANTVLSVHAQQGDPNPMTTDPDGLVDQVVPAPPVQAFPTFDFYTAQTTALAAGRQMTATQLNALITNAQACATAAPASNGTHSLAPLRPAWRPTLPPPSTLERE